MSDHTKRPHDPDIRPVEQDITCPQCGAWLVLRWSGLRRRWQYRCIAFPLCRCCHGCHSDGKPYGTPPADQQTSQLRQQTHYAFDRLWKRGDGCLALFSRTTAYRWLAGKLGMRFGDCHIGAFDSDQCLKAIDVCEALEAEHVGEW